MIEKTTTLRRAALAATLAGALLAAPAAADFVILDDLIVDGSACVGFDCVNGESFGFDTIRLKENNLRIRFMDTSTVPGYPSNDWQLTANDSSSGGANKFSIDDIDGGRTPFTIEASAPSHSLFVDDGGRLGFGTSTPVVELHVVDGDTPTLRLEQDGSSGFTPQTWDVAGNETNFFIRDVTNGSKLPLRIRPNAPSNSVYIDTGGELGLGTSSPAQEIHLRGSNPQVRFEDATDSADFWAFGLNANEDFIFNFQGAGTPELRISQAGQLVVNGTPMNVPDYVFEPDYRLMPLAELEAFVRRERHLPNVPSSQEIRRTGLDLTEFPLRLLEKVEEQALYILQLEKRIATLESALPR